jgi:hypothetical protein
VALCLSRVRLEALEAVVFLGHAQSTGADAQAAETIRRHIANIVTYYQHPVTNAISEGLNSQIQKIKSMACGFRNIEHFKTAIYFHCGGLDLCPC